MSAAENAFRSSADIWERLVVTAPGNALWESHYAKALYELGDLARRQGKRHSALADHSQAVQLLQEILRREPESLNAHRFLGIALCDRGKLLRDMQRYEEALRDFDRALAVHADESRDAVRLERSYAMVLTGNYREAAVEARESLTAMSEKCDIHFLAPSFLIGAKVCGRAAGLALTDATLERADRVQAHADYSDAAIGLLRQAIEAGLDFTPDIRQAPDFESLSDDPAFLALN